jgi:hypothetical protein
MKTRLFIFAVFLFSFSALAGQDISPITKFLLKKGYTFPDSTKNTRKSPKTNQWPDTLYYNTVYKSKLLGSITVPFISSGVEIKGGILKGKDSVTTTLSIGLGYTWFWGDFIFNENDKITVDPKVFFGLAATTGLSNGLNLEKGGLYVTGFIGVSSFSILFGYDIINKSPTLGLGGRIDLYSISQKYLHILGKVHAVRKHKKIAFPITAE